MNSRIAAAAVILVGLLAAPAASRARPIRPTLIPNGTVRGCINCHFDPAGGVPVSSTAGLTLLAGLLLGMGLVARWKRRRT